MHVVLLGTAAGGGFPQWNCWCPSCRAVREDPAAAAPRSQSSAAVSADGTHWFLLNASPDVRDQLRLLASAPAAGAVRHVPVEGVVLTDAELDHSLGIVLLREARALRIHATPAVARILAEDSRILAVTGAFADVEVVPLAPGTATPLVRRDGSPSGLLVEPFLVAAGPPRFATRDEPGHTVGLVITDAGRGTRCAFVPGAGALDDALMARLATCDLVLFDGTFWDDDEMVRLGISTKRARELDHLPVGGPDGSLARLAALPARHRVYTHVNNTNPMLLSRSPEREEVERHGLAVGHDGMRFVL